MIKEYKKYTTLTIIIFLIFLSFLYMFRNKNYIYEFEPEYVESIKDDSIGIEELEEVIIKEQVPIYVCGEVQNPDVYYIEEGSIIKDAIILAGGFTDVANKEAWNLAKEIQPGLKIDVPKVGEEIDKMTNSYDNSIEDGTMLDIYNVDPSNRPIKLININKARANELTVLPGIGPVIANNIIQYREANGEFTSIEDIKKVPRIGLVTLEKIKDYICVQ